LHIKHSFIFHAALFSHRAIFFLKTSETQQKKMRLLERVYY